MSAETTNNEYGKGSVDHVPNITPLRTYLLAWGALMVLTVITVAVSYVDFGAFDIVVALGVAAMKAAVVALVFMHLWDDSKFNSIIFLSALLFLALFITFTMFDTESRGVNEAGGLKRPADITRPFAGTLEEAQMRAAWERKEEATEAAAVAAEPVLPPLENEGVKKEEPAPTEAAAAAEAAAAEEGAAAEAPAEKAAPAEEDSAEAEEPAGP